MIEIKKVQNKKALKSFIKFYTDLYKENKQCALPIDFDEIKTLTEKNPAFEFCEFQAWLAYKNGQIVGRIAAIINQKEPEPEFGRIGWVDFIDDYEISKSLFDTATAWLKEKGKSHVHGPLGFTDMDRQGLLYKGFDKESTMATLYNFPYYVEHFEAYGFEKSIDWIEYSMDLTQQFPERIRKLAKFVKNHYGVRSIEFKNKKEIKPYIPKIFDLINRSYAHLYGFTELTEGQKQYYAENYFSFINLNLIRLIEDEDKNLVGFGITMPSFTQALQKAKGKLLPFGWYHMLSALKKNDVLDLYLVAIEPEWRKKGINAIMMQEIWDNARDFGIKRIETNIQLETNLEVQGMFKHLSPELHKKRRCYKKEL
ncbi:MAG: GNAT family N-acetyltransferase [Flavobacteriales bacterium]|jgi:GNAT superfamily N-acetyltransferase|nr:GNAT family N-acetyltransferase [Flavobacteriales bacterium]